VHPLGIGSPFFRTLPLEKHGLSWINPEGAYVHAFKPERALLVQQDLDKTADNLGSNGGSFRALMARLLPNWDELCSALLQPTRLLQYPVALAKFGWPALMSARGLADRYLTGPESKAVFAGVAAHSSLKLDALGSASIGLSLAIAAHGVGWPIPKDGAQAITDSLVQYFVSLGGELIVDCPVRSLSELPACEMLFLDIKFLRLAH
jgi:phytoene dehydrogenase-like protein